MSRFSSNLNYIILYTFVWSIVTTVWFLAFNDLPIIDALFLLMPIYALIIIAIFYYFSPQPKFVEIYDDSVTYDKYFVFKTKMKLFLNHSITNEFNINVYGRYLREFKEHSNITGINVITDESRQSVSWYKDGLLHREDGPAIVDKRKGTQEWWLNGERHRLDGPALIFQNNHQYWFQFGKIHSDDGPAIIRGDSKEWWKNGFLHREDGPAIEDGRNGRSWFLNGRLVTPMEIFDQMSEEQKEKAIWELDQWK